MYRKILLLLVVFHALGGRALPVNHTDDQVEAPILSGTFQNPSVNVRPRFRYWLPDASINTTFLSDDIAQLAQRGAGGVEFLNYFDYGGLVAPPSTDWNIYGYGTPAYREVLKAALEAHKDHGLIMDFSMGPQSGQGVPAAPDEIGLAYNLYFYNASLSECECFIGTCECFMGTLPGWGSGELVSALTFAITNTTGVSSLITGTSILVGDVVNASQYLISPSVNSTQYTISSESLTDVTDLVREDGSISITAPSIDGALSYMLLTSYYSRSYARACVASSPNPENILQNGSFAVDHFSQAGAQLTTDFLEKYILIDGIDDLMREVGNYIWEDSVEIPSQVMWTPNLTHVFREQHGYGIEKYVPLLAGKNGAQEMGSSIGSTFFVFDTPNEGAGIVGDYRETLTYLLGIYYDWLTNWTNSYLNLQFSGQIGYNLPVDMLSNIPRVNAPETESLSFNNNLDSFRQYCGPANLAGKRVISMEMGSDYLETYTQTWTDLLKDGKRAFVTGVNQAIFHGAPYSHTYPNTTWPGFTTFQYSFGAHHSRHQPAWDVGYAHAINYVARTQFVLQTGVPKVDLVFWDKKTAEYAYPNTSYVPSDLSTAGYTYTYLSPDNFALDVAQVRNGILAPSAQSFRALIVRANETLTVDGVLALEKFAKAELPIIFSGGIPTVYNTRNGKDTEHTQGILESILSLPNVYKVSYESLACAVASIGVSPRTKVNTNGTWFTHWREDSNGDVYVFIYNDGVPSVGNISFETTQRPIFLNAWTGEQTPVVYYTVDGLYTTIPFSLGYTETAIIKFSKEGNVPHEHIVSTPDVELYFRHFATSGRPSVRIFAQGDVNEPIVLSNGSLVEVHSPVPKAFSLKKWTLTVEQWLPPTDLYNVEIVADKSNITFSLPGSNLESWSSISDSLINVSGIGYYNTTFHWPPSGCTHDQLGALLTIPPIPQGITVSLNGKELPNVDITHPIVDISAYVQQDKNVLSISVASTLWNVLTPIWPKLSTGRSTATPSVEAFQALGFGALQDYGIIGEVQVVPYVGLDL
ncbi:hypothetical protein POJ06DRAFT_136574 [Lipomyces tetrasporus]|uniref:Secreted protein n=1 Tax=Lipomyces tetrasporus TaxID=54092 RepID=A0AAD7QNW4_9ASCO|nr:uncharacterized protein POJ06DRAFT_136574 [Lipomyces tetrasporus]KAJ8098505.1 hypothetical protein POJ06DRAFT_136574 [Lipomyces tetrasporus]